MKQKTQFDLNDLPVVIDTIIDEQNRETVLTLVIEGEGGVSGYLELQVEADNDGTISAWWKWVVNEPMQEEAYTGTTELLYDAATELKDSMADMLDFIKRRDAD